MTWVDERSQRCLAKFCERRGRCARPLHDNARSMKQSLARLGCCGLLGVAAGGALAAGNDNADGCLIVFGQGRNAVDGDSAANELWNSVNLAFNTEVAARLRAANQNAVAVVLRVTASDLKGNTEKLLTRAAADHCRAIVETTIFADYAAGTLVARIRHYSIVVEAAAGADEPVARIGPPKYVVERNFQLTRGTLDRVRPAALGAEMAGELIERGLK